MNLLYVPVKDDEEARKIAKHLLEKKLIACANFFPGKSMYLWENEIKEDTETFMIIKPLKEEAKQEIEKLHSYDVPCILELPTKANKKYQEWINGSSC